MFLWNEKNRLYIFIAKVWFLEKIKSQKSPLILTSMRPRICEATCFFGTILQNNLQTSRAYKYYIKRIRSKSYLGWSKFCFRPLSKKENTKQEKYDEMGDLVLLECDQLFHELVHRFFVKWWLWFAKRIRNMSEFGQRGTRLELELSSGFILTWSRCAPGIWIHSFRLTKREKALLKRLSLTTSPHSF